MILFAIICNLFLCVTCEDLNLLNHINEIINQTPNPNLIICNMEFNIERKRTLFSMNKSLKWIKNLETTNVKSYKENSLILCLDGVSVQEWEKLIALNIGHYYPVFALTSDLRQWKENVANIRINQEVYIIDIINNQKYETYTIGTKPMFTEVKTDPFIKRRSNFKGIELKSMTDHQSPFLHIEQSQLNLAQFDSGDNVWVLNDDDVYGAFDDVLDVLKMELNFSVTQYVRTDGKWGGQYQNGIFKILNLSLTPNVFQRCDTKFLKKNRTLIFFAFSTKTNL